MNRLMVLFLMVALLAIGNLGVNRSVWGQYMSRQDLVEHFKGSKEPTAKDAAWTSNTTFKVGVLDDGSPRDGYAMYVCEVLHENGFKGRKILVRIIDIAKLVRTGKWINLGTAWCQ